MSDPLERLLREQRVAYVPALYKIFDEILVNAADNHQRDAGTTRVDVSIDAAGSRVRVAGGA